jgi:hypothetical protein
MFSFSGGSCGYAFVVSCTGAAPVSSDALCQSPIRPGCGYRYARRHRRPRLCRINRRGLLPRPSVRSGVRLSIMLCYPAGWLRARLSILLVCSGRPGYVAAFARLDPRLASGQVLFRLTASVSQAIRL